MSDAPNPFASPLAADPTSPAPDHPAKLDAAALTYVRTGLLCVYLSICGILLTAIGGSLLATVLGAGAAETAVLFGGVLLFWILGLVGNGFCIAAPQESGAKPLAIASLVLVVAAVGIGLVLGVFTVVETSQTAGPLGGPPNTDPVVGVDSMAWQIAVQLLTNLMSIASTVCFLLFMRKIANYVGRPDVAQRSTRIIITGVVAIALMFGGTLSVRVLGAGFLVVPVLLGGLVGLFAFVMYANMVTYLRKAIGEALAN